MKAIVSRLIAAAAVALAGFSTVAHAQGPGAAGGDPLNLTPDQKAKMTAIQKKYEPEATKLMAKYKPQMDAIQKKYEKQALALQKDKTPAGQQKLQSLSMAAQKEALPIIQKMMKDRAPLMAKATKEVEAILDPKQKKMFQQMMAAQAPQGGGAMKR